jgi:glycosyltransferase involved in cell wall biosynthesis
VIPERKMMLDIVYVMHEYPVTSQTFVENEALALESLGRNVARFPLHVPRRSRAISPQVLAPGDVRGKIRSFQGITKELFYLFKVRAEVITAMRSTDEGLKALSRQIFALGKAIQLAALIRPRLGDRVYLHGHFLGRCLDVVSYAGILLGSAAKTSATGHAADVTSPSSLDHFTRFVQGLDKVVCASDSVARSLLTNSGRKADAIIHCGVARQELIAERPMSKLHILSVGRLVEKKGFDDSIEAARILKGMGVAFSWKIIGGGPLDESLRSLIRASDCEDCIALEGPLANTDVIEVLRQWADAFVLASRPTTSGDVDGIPVALMEAMSFGIPVVSTRLSGIPELVIEGETGLLVTPRAPREIAEALRKVAEDRNFARSIGVAGREFVSAYFDNIGEASKMEKMVFTSNTPPRNAGPIAD